MRSRFVESSFCFVRGWFRDLFIHVRSLDCFIRVKAFFFFFFFPHFVRWRFVDLCFRSLIAFVGALICFNLFKGALHAFGDTFCRKV